jgi:hypothetical protein
MQRHPGRAADEWRSSVTYDAGDTAESAAGHDSAGGNPVGQHQHRSANGRGADTEYACLCREHDDEFGYARHDGTGQRYGCCGIAGRIPCIAIRLLSRNDFASSRLRRATANGPGEGSKLQTRAGRSQTSLRPPQATAPNSKMSFIKWYLMVRPARRAYLQS